MSKTYDLQVEKARLLVEGLKKNYQQVAPYGITESALSKLADDANETERLSNELDALRVQVNEKASIANHKLNELREELQEMKQIIKKNFEQTQWESLGIPDKR
ncbi:MAG: hypothetical protein IJ467_01655 [Bacteroidaceae bacterium]|nr:hypothetical protein [Bacteroidaceae bacterium]